MSQLRSMLIVDDDKELREALAEQLALSGEFEVAQAATGSEGVARALSLQPDLVIMDVGLPDMDGRDAVRDLRRRAFRRPVIILSGRDSEADTVVGLESGANDYIAKPFRFAELLARVRVQLRQLDASEDAEFRIGPYIFRPSQKTLTDLQGKKVRLTEKETAILRYLLRADRRPVGRETLLREVWEYNANVDTHTLETHIYRLRQKMETYPNSAQLLVTDPEGYKLLA